MFEYRTPNLESGPGSLPNLKQLEALFSDKPASLNQFPRQKKIQTICRMLEIGYHLATKRRSKIESINKLRKSKAKGKDKDIQSDERDKKILQTKDSFQKEALVQAGMSPSGHLKILNLKDNK